MGLDLRIDNAGIGGADISVDDGEVLELIYSYARCGEGLEMLSAMAIVEDSEGELPEDIVSEIFRAYDSCNNRDKGYFNGEMIGTLDEFLNAENWRKFRTSRDLEWELDALGYVDKKAMGANTKRLVKHGPI